MLSSFAVRNFKSIEDSGKLQLKPLTIFVGPNSSGKSSILESLAVLAQTTNLRLAGGIGGYIEPSLTKSLTHGEFLQYPHPSTDYL